MSDPGRQRVLEGGPPSTVLVYKVLRHEGSYYYTELQEACYMADSTAHEAVSYLLDHDLIARERDDEDLRRSRYYIPTD